MRGMICSCKDPGRAGCRSLTGGIEFSEPHGALGGRVWSAENSYRNGENAPGESFGNSSATYGRIDLLPTPHPHSSKGSVF